MAGRGMAAVAPAAAPAAPRPARPWLAWGLGAPAGRAAAPPRGPRPGAARHADPEGAAHASGVLGACVALCAPVVDSALRRRGTRALPAVVRRTEARISSPRSVGGKLKGFQLPPRRTMPETIEQSFGHAPDLERGGLHPRHMNSWSYRKEPDGNFQYAHDKEEYKANIPVFGKYAIQAVEEAWVTSRQIERARRILVEQMGRRGKVFMRVFPHRSLPQRNAESKMGFSKGKFEYWVAAVKASFILFEIDGVPEDTAYQAFREASRFLKMKVKWMKREPPPTMFELDDQMPQQDQYAASQEEFQEEFQEEPAVQHRA